MDARTIMFDVILILANKFLLDIIDLRYCFFCFIYVFILQLSLCVLYLFVFIKCRKKNKKSTRRGCGISIPSM